MIDQSQISDQENLRDLRDVTFSQALQAGSTHLGWLVGQKSAKSGPDHVLASHSVSLDRAEELTTRGTYGPLFGGSSLSDDLIRSTASKLRQALDVNGSPEYLMIWKRWDIGFREPICRLAASARLTSGSGCFGWPTPASRDYKSESATEEFNAKRDGYARGKPLSYLVTLVGWPMPQAGTPAQNGYNQAGNTDSSRKTVELAGWNTPHTPRTPRQHNSDNSNSTYLGRQAELVGWATPNAADAVGTHGGYQRASLRTQTSGVKLTTSTAQTKSGGQLNPEHSRWLQGYPVEWGCCGAMAIQSSRKSLRNS